MLVGLLLILACQLAGEVVVRTTGVPVPGPVVGLVVFLVYLRLRTPPEDAAAVRVARTLLQHLALLFVPAGVGVITFVGLLSQQWVAALGGLVLGWLAAFVAAAVAAAALLRISRGAS